jgi:hypothetical protein
MCAARGAQAVAGGRRRCGAAAARGAAERGTRAGVLRIIITNNNYNKIVSHCERGSEREVRVKDDSWEGGCGRWGLAMLASIRTEERAGSPGPSGPRCGPWSMVGPLRDPPALFPTSSSPACAPMPF